MSDNPSLYRLDAGREAASPARWLVLGGLVVALLALFVVRTYAARTLTPPRLFDLFDTLAVAGSALVLATGYRRLTRADWLVGLGVGLFVGVHLPFATLFGVYPFLGVVRSDVLQALIRGGYTAIAALGGLVIMHRGGPVRLSVMAGGVRGGRAFLFGALVGLPLAVLNAFANAWQQGGAFQWQSPLAAALDALQPALVEEVIYRLAFLGLLWLLLRRTWPTQQAAWLAGMLSLLVHTYAHFSDELVTQPLATLGLGAVLGLLWGVPLTLLALRRNLDSAVGFHWVQDFARFWAGF